MTTPIEALIDNLREALPMMGDSDEILCVVTGYDLRAAVDALSAIAAAEKVEPTIERYETVEDVIRALHAFAAPQSAPEPVAWLHEAGNACYAGDNANVPGYTIPLYRRAPTAEPAPRFTNTSCSQCGQEFGPGNSGFSHCQEHAHKRATA